MRIFSVRLYSRTTLSDDRTMFSDWDLACEFARNSVSKNGKKITEGLGTSLHNGLRRLEVFPIEDGERGTTGLLVEEFEIYR